MLRSVLLRLKPLRQRRVEPASYTFCEKQALDHRRCWTTRNVRDILVEVARQHSAVMV